MSSNVIEYCSEKNISINLFDFRGKLLSIEGRAASCYWELIEKMLNDYIDFEGRVRKGAKDIVNCALNYGYGILYSRIWEVVISTGLNPNISYLHKSQDNDKPSLIYDLIEQFRQMVVDKAVFSIITKNEELKMENEFLDIKTRKRVAEKVLERLNCMESSKGDLMHRV
ncbi:CRISPR-associated endonuclease Cas1 [Candidatus Poribacteria bacterium]|nr:CRISPR-associated endonuclease Cas1 [Candidatus Poribacteria bacterium]